MRKSIVSHRIAPYVFLASLAFAPLTYAADELRADQKAAIEKVLATVDPSMREMIRPQIEQSIVYLTPQQVAMFVSSATGEGASSSTPEQAPAQEAPKGQATPEDLAYNSAQYEPAIRKHWHGRKSFDDFVEAELKAKCPSRGKYAVYREAERYELLELNPNWQRASWSADGEVQVWGSTYVPQDGRYDFDFSKVRMTFDKESVVSAITKACADWAKEAAAFHEEALALMNSGQSGAAHNLESTASSRAASIQASLETVLDAEGPAGNFNSALMDALQNPKPVM
jgi:hypothetical protein